MPSQTSFYLQDMYMLQHAFWDPREGMWRTDSWWQCSVSTFPLTYWDFKSVINIVMEMYCTTGHGYAGSCNPLCQHYKETTCWAWNTGRVKTNQVTTLQASISFTTSGFKSAYSSSRPTEPLQLIMTADQGPYLFIFIFSLNHFIKVRSILILG